MSGTVDINRNIESPCFVEIVFQGGRQSCKQNKSFNIVFYMMYGHTEKRIYTSSGETGGGKRRKKVYVTLHRNYCSGQTSIFL